MNLITVVHVCDSVRIPARELAQSGKALHPVTLEFSFLFQPSSFFFSFLFFSSLLFSLKLQTSKSTLYGVIQSI